MIEMLLPILVFFAVMAIGGAIIAGTMSRRKAVPRLRSMRGELTMPSEGSAGVSRLLTSVGEASSSKTSSTLKQQLAMAGYFSQSASATYIGVKIVLLVIGLSIGFIVTLFLTATMATKLYVIVAIPAALFFIPNIVVSARRSARRAEVRAHLPDVVDLLEICVSAGMGLDMAWNSVTDEIRSVSNTIADEMALTMLETQLGAPRTVAMRHMSERTGAQELASLVALLVQSDRFGTSISDALRTFATSMRNNRSQRAEEAAEKTAVKLLIPLVFCIFPVMLIVTVGPAAIRLYEVFSGS